MANNYTLFSTGIEAKPADLKWLRAQLKRALGKVDKEGMPLMDFAWAIEGSTIVMYSEEAGDIEHVANFVQKFLKKFRPKDCHSIEFAFTCSRPRIGEFGGGAVFITAKDQRYMLTSSWVRDQEANFKNVKR